jgi:hypothetical protein
MPALIRTLCPTCGVVHLEPADVTLVHSPREALFWYVFDCTGCARQVVKTAADAVSAALVHARVKLWPVPAEVLEREEGPTLRTDDLLDIVLALRSTDNLAALAA